MCVCETCAGRQGAEEVRFRFFYVLRVSMQTNVSRLLRLSFLQNLWEEHA